jgi:Secretion system C-terminal sorting domain
MKYFQLIFLCLIGPFSHAQLNDELVIHEWGTFTSKYSSNGIPYSNVNATVDEPVPDFVHSIDFDTTYELYISAKGYSGYGTGRIDLIDVYIKMETPVLYFYSPHAIQDLTVDVQFPNGSISEFYPLPYHREDTTYVKRRASSAGRYGYARLSFKNYGGFAKWKVNILAPSDNRLLTHPDNKVPNLWLAPRKTKANKIECNGDVEKYIFYRGLGSFTNPIIPKYTQNGNLLIKNNGSQIKYAMVYEMTDDGKRYIWGIHSLSENSTSLVSSNKIEVLNREWTVGYRNGFIDALVNAGLFEDEARAMLNTWEQSYFEKPGIKIFWIVPRAFTDTILPISFSQKANSLERVMVGRTEIDPYNIDEKDSYEIDPDDENMAPKYGIYPNPVHKEVFVKSNNNITSLIEVELKDFAGRHVLTKKIKILPQIGGAVNLETVSPGIYYLQISDVPNRGFKLIVE